MDSSSVLVWNVRGLDDRGHCDTVRKVVNSCKPNLICLQETKMSLIDIRDILSLVVISENLFSCQPKGLEGVS